MKQYLDLMQNVLTNGVLQENRTGIRTLMIPGAMMQFNMDLGFTALTTKKLAFSAVKGELLGFLRGYTSAAQFRELGCGIWDQNANENKAWLNSPVRIGEDDLGYIYSKLWTDMPFNDKDQPYSGKEKWNQIDLLISEIKRDPTSRRLIVSAWHPEVFYRAALPPCHVLFQVLIEQRTNRMHMTMYQRSCDVFLGVPFNIASYALLLHLLCRVTGYIPGTFTWFGADVHIYENHLDQVQEQLTREPKPLPNLLLDGRIGLGTDLASITPEEIMLVNYSSHPPIKAPMAV